MENNPPVPTDFAASYKDPDQAHLVKYSKFSDNQSFYGTSMFSQKQAVQNLIESNPHRFRKKLVAYGQVEAQHGVVGKESVAKHVTVWFYDGVSPNGFVVI
ncbi:hypothetical protein AMR44_17515 [Shewanella algae]|nr:hypothetical protein AMR44_17515 [Shewanella algae]